jgi:hypothetical protein
MKARPAALAAALTAVLAFTLTACGGSGKAGGSGAGPDTELSATPAAQVTAAPPADAKVISVTVKGDSVSPTAETVKVKVNQPIVFKIDADKAGELHVHTTPAQAVNYPAGTSQVQIKITRPGVIEAEIEQLGKLVVELEVQ